MLAPLGHAYTAQNLVADQEEGIERALGAALCLMEDQAETQRTLAEDLHAIGQQALAGDYERQAAEHRTHAGLIRELLLRKV